MRENPYAGINAHLNSSLQTAGTIDQPALWHTFHVSHIGYITEALTAQLPDQYIAFEEQSLQIRSLEIFEDDALNRRTPDITIFQSGSGSPMLAEAPAPTWQARVADVLEEITRPPPAAIIRELLPQGKLGRIVSRIELLSPSNKPHGSGYDAYVIKRAEAIREGVPLVEIDYLHETSPIVTRLPRYPRQPNAYPYWIIITDPRPDWDEGKVQGYGFHIGEPIKTIPIPLAGNDVLLFDLNVVYQRTFEARRWGSLMDYTLEPERFETYSAEDQARIKAIMASLQA